MNKVNSKYINYRVTYLEMTDLPNFYWPKTFKQKINILLAEKIPSWYFIYLYNQVGKDFYWTDWLHKSENEINNFINDKNIFFYSLIKDGWTAGFYVLDYRQKDICDLSYIGLVKEAIGIGLGKYLLKTAILTAWEKRKIKKLTINTCTLDHKNALYLYQKYGFRPVGYKEFDKYV